jgi:hypothetical protein
MGRPPKSGERKGVNLTFRTKLDLKSLLQKAASDSGRSLSEEMESRIEDSFRTQDLIRTLGGPQADPVVRPILYYLGALEKHGMNWRSDPKAAEAVREGISVITEGVFGGALSRERQKSLLDSVARRGKSAITAVVTAMAVLAIFALTEKPPS